MMSISTIATSGVDSSMVDGLAAGAGGKHVHSAALENAAEGEDVAHVVVDDQHLLAHQLLVGAMQPIQHVLLFARQIGDHAVQEQRGFVEQPLRRFDALHDHAASQRVQPRILFRRQFLAGEYHHGHVAHVGVSRMRSSTSKPLMSGRRRSSTTQSKASFCTSVERLRAGGGDGDVDVVVAQQFADADLLGSIVFHHQQALAARRGVFLDAR